MTSSQYEEEVRKRIIRACKSGKDGFQDVLLQAEGADPRLVGKILNEVQSDTPGSTVQTQDLASIRSQIFNDLPASDPALGQWWYTPETQEELAQRILELRQGSSEFKVLCIGVPTVATLLAKAGCNVQLAESDPDIVDAVSREESNLTIHHVDLLATQGDFALANAVIVDPPWYEHEMREFLRQGANKLVEQGTLFVSLPPLLTRPNSASERESLLQLLQLHGFQVQFLDRNVIKYVVPRFEESAFNDVPGFCGQPWRVADLLVCIKSKTKEWNQLDESESSSPKSITRYSRDPHEFRVFATKDEANGDPQTIITKVDEFSSNVSRRAFQVDPDIWTSEKVGAIIEDFGHANFILSCWQNGHGKSDTVSKMVTEQDLTEGTVKAIVDKYDDVLEIWSRFGSGYGRRNPDDILKAKDTANSDWAAKSSAREHTEESDGFRLQFSRDRDRTLWSSSFRALAGKTQLFPVESGDQLRQRLTHSIEVMQLAGTIAESFGLDRDLVEAGSLAHDIGHTPFGHAGEYALDSLFSRSGERSTPGFNHYEHGVDVVRFLEGPYSHQPAASHSGLNLTPEVCECIFKHTYCQGGNSASHDTFRQKSKHASFLQDGYCHLEGQAVRIADKVSYLVSDIEDGIQLNAIGEESLMSCRLFHRPPIDLSQPKGEPLIRRFLLQRRNLLRLLMEDIILETGRRLAKLSSISSVRSNDDYVVNHSPAFDADVKEVWKKLQAGNLHKDPRVIRANMNAARIVSELFYLFSIIPETVPTMFRQEHERLWSGPYIDFFKGKFGPNISIPTQFTSFLPLDRFIGFSRNQNQTIDVKVEEFTLAKDYVASLSDDYARKLHAEYLG